MAPTPALYRERMGADWIDVEIIDSHPEGVIVREVGRFFRGVWIAGRDQVREPTGGILLLREPFGNEREAA